jgi:hypothetical protein
MAENRAFRRVVVAGVNVDGPPIHRVNLVGRDTMVVIHDEGNALPRNVSGAFEPARIDLGAHQFPYRYRLLASIAIAEAARQTGFRPAGLPKMPRRRGLTYESVLSTVSTDRGQEVDPVVLKAY